MTTDLALLPSLQQTYRVAIETQTTKRSRQLLRWCIYGLYAFFTAGTCSLPEALHYLSFLLTETYCIKILWIIILTFGEFFWTVSSKYLALNGLTLYQNGGWTYCFHWPKCVEKAFPHPVFSFLHYFFQYPKPPSAYLCSNNDNAHVPGFTWITMALFIHLSLIYSEVY